MKLYRIIDFFELIQTLQTGKFRIPNAQRFTDPNELIGMLFSTLSNPRFAPLTESGVKDLIRSQDCLRQSHYISCWTRNRDSIAMWEIYSPGRISVQIEADKDEIAANLTKFADEHSFVNAHHKPADHPETYFYPLDIGECNYDDLQAVHDRLKERTRILSEQATSLIIEGNNDAFREHYEQACDQASDRRHELFLLKDRAYAHENEVRFSLRAVRRNGRRYEECEKDFGFILFDTHLRLATREEAGANIFAEFPSHLIKHVYLDGRAPEWQINAQKTLLEGHGFGISQSHAYGTFVDRTPLSKWWD